MESRISKQLGEWGIAYMKTNNTQFFKIRILFILVGIMFFTCFFFVVQQYQNMATNAINDAANTLITTHPDMQQVVLEAFFHPTVQSTSDNTYITLSFNMEYIVVLLVGLLVLFGCYRYAYSQTKKQLLQIRNLVKALDQDVVLEKPLEGDLAILNEKLIGYRRNHQHAQESLWQEKQKLASYIEDIAHQIKTPLTSIKVNEELLALEKTNDMLETNALQIQRIETLLESLLTLARFDNQKIVFDKIETSLQSIIIASLLQLQPLIEKQKVHVKVKNIDIQAVVDESWMQEAITNIIKNCIEAANTTVNIEGEKYEQCIKLIIQDDGDKIAVEDMPHIFTRFYRSKHNKGKGIGIGLALAKEIVQAHHGFIEVSNDVGAIFTITLPIYDLKQ